MSISTITKEKMYRDELSVFDTTLDEYIRQMDYNTGVRFTRDELMNVNWNSPLSQFVHDEFMSINKVSDWVTSFVNLEDWWECVIDDYEIIYNNEEIIICDGKY